jgi:hypothetical protein
MPHTMLLSSIFFIFSFSFCSRSFILHHSFPIPDVLFKVEHSPKAADALVELQAWLKGQRIKGSSAPSLMIAHNAK